MARLLRNFRYRRLNDAVDPDNVSYAAILESILELDQDFYLFPESYVPSLQTLCVKSVVRQSGALLAPYASLGPERLLRQRPAGPFDLLPPPLCDLLSDLLLSLRDPQAVFVPLYALISPYTRCLCVREPLADAAPVEPLVAARARALREVTWLAPVTPALLALLAGSPQLSVFITEEAVDAAGVEHLLARCPALRVLQLADSGCVAALRRRGRRWPALRDLRLLVDAAVELAAVGRLFPRLESLTVRPATPGETWRIEDDSTAEIGAGDSSADAEEYDEHANIEGLGKDNDTIPNVQGLSEDNVESQNVEIQNDDTGHTNNVQERNASASGDGSCFECLTTLSLTHCESVGFLATPLPALTALTLERCGCDGALLGRHPRLRRLSLVGCPAVVATAGAASVETLSLSAGGDTKVCLPSLSAAFPRVRQLALSGGVPLAAAAAGFPALRRLRLGARSSVAAERALAALPLPQLRELALRYDADDDAPLAVESLRRCARLAELELEGFSAVSVPADLRLDAVRLLRLRGGTCRPQMVTWLLRCLPRVHRLQLVDVYIVTESWAPLFSQLRQAGVAVELDGGCTIPAWRRSGIRVAAE